MPEGISSINVTSSNHWVTVLEQRLNRLNMLLYFVMFLIYQITATNSLYIDNHPAYFDDSQIEQVSFQGADIFHASQLPQKQPLRLLNLWSNCASNPERFGNQRLSVCYLVQAAGQSFIHLLRFRLKASMIQTTSVHLEKTPFMFFKIWIKERRKF